MKTKTSTQKIGKGKFGKKDLSQSELFNVFRDMCPSDEDCLETVKQAQIAYGGFQIEYVEHWNDGYNDDLREEFW